ncbi:SDR family oxidoreductase [Streptomyces sp. CB01373]|uniref:SDR family oxidoreductase n=1 Tax=Streptomyces sp. CB01373 TaxID=2020325 RepID=UPI0018FE360E|nr:SDR family oxidoreductase [Streptomyces sp. CB01373]
MVLDGPLYAPPAPGASRQSWFDREHLPHLRPLPGAAHYAASKAAIEQLTRAWAVELAEAGIRVNVVAPGPTESEALGASGLPAPVVEQIKQQ